MTILKRSENVHEMIWNEVLLFAWSVMYPAAINRDNFRVGFMVALLLFLDMSIGQTII